MQSSDPQRDQQQPRGKNRRRIFVRLLVYPLVFLLALTLGSLWFLQTAKVRSLIKTYIEQAAARHLQADLRIGAISGSLLFDLSLEQVRVSHNGEQILTAERVSASYLLPLLLTRVLAISEVEIDQMVLNLAVEKTGRLNIARLVPAGGAPAGAESASLPFRVFVSRAAISEAQVILTDRRQDAAPPRRITHIRLAAGLKLSPRGAAAIRILDLGFSADRPAFSLNRLTGGVGYFPDKGRLELQDLRLRLPESDLSVNGRLDLESSGPKFDIRTALTTLSLEELGKILSLPELDRGSLTGTLQVKGTPDRFLHEARLKMGKMTLSSRGAIARADPESLDLDVAATIQHLNPAALPVKGLQGLSGDIGSEIHFAGTDLIRAGRRIRLSLNLKPSRISGIDLSGGAIEGVFDAAGISLEEGVLSGPWGELTVRKGLADVFDPSRPGRLSLEASLRNLDPAGSGMTDLSGKINLRLEASAVLPRLADGSLNPAAAAGQASIGIDPSRIQAIRIQDGLIQTSWNGRDLNLKTLAIKGHDGHLTVSGKITPAIRSSRLQFEVDLSDLSQIASLAPKLFPDRLPPLGPSDVQGGITAGGRFSGWWDRPNLSITLTGRDLRYQTVFAENIKAQGTVKGSLKDLRVTAAFGTDNLSADGVEIPRLDLSLELTPQAAQLELALLHEKNLKLTASGRITDWQQPAKEVTIDALRLVSTKTAGNPVLGAIQEIRNSGPIRMIFGPEAAQIASLKLVSENAAFSLAGSLAAGDRIQASLKLENLDIDRLPQVVKGLEEFSGILSVEAKLSGTLAKPVFQTRLHIRDAAGYAFSLSEIEASLSYSAARADFKADGYLRRRKVLEVSGEAGLLCSLKPFNFKPQPGGFKADVTADGLRISALPIPKPANVEFDGELSLKASAEGELGDPKFSGSLTIKDGFFSTTGDWPANLSFSVFNLVYGYDGSQATLNGSAYRRTQKLMDFSGRTGCRISLYPFEFSPLGNGLKMAFLTQGVKLSELPLPRSPAFDYDGRLNLTLDVAGDWAAPTVKGEAVLQEGFLAPEGKDPDQYAFSDLTVRLHYDGAEAAVSAALMREKQKILDLSGRAGMKFSLLPFRFVLRDEGFKADAEARNLKLSMLPIPRGKGIDFDALLTVSATAAGSLSRPLITGSLALQDGFLTLTDPDLSYETVRARVDFSGDEIVIQNFSLMGDTEGSLNLSGRIGIEGAKPKAFDIRLTGENAYIPYQKIVTARIRPDLALSGTPRRPVLKGALTVTEARINLERLSARGPAEIQIETTPPPGQGTIEITEQRSAAEEILKPLAADVTVSVPKNAWLKGQGVNAEISGQINLEKEADTPPVLIGSLSTVRGTYEFQGKVFRITQGNVDFLGQKDLNPNLDIQAETRVAKVTIIIRITGLADKLTLSLDSDPSMDRTDIISYLVFGKPASELNQQQSSNAEQAALNTTGRLAARELKNLLGETLSLDVLTLESQGEDISKSALAVGKYVTPDIFVLYRQSFNAEDPNELEITYELNRNFSIETQLGDEKTTGIDFVWDFDF